MLDYAKINLTGVFYVDEAYSQNHAHMLHKHKDILELLYIASGEGRYVVGGRGYAVREGDLVICNADTIHGEAPFQKHLMQTYCIALNNVKPENLKVGCLLDTKARPIVSLGNYTDVIASSMTNIYKIYEEDKDNIAICRQFALGILMIVEKLIIAHNEQEKNKIRSEQKNEALVRKITDYLNHHYTEQLSLKTISKAMHISETYLSHLYKRETGLSPIQYVIHCRIGEAQSLLMETDLPIYEIEERLGFGSSCHLTTMFKKYVGISLREYRKHFAGKK